MRLDTKVAVYKSAVLSVLLFGRVVDATSSPYQKARPVSHEMPPTNSSRQVARQDPKYRSLAEMSNYRHRSIPANNATPMDRTCRKNGQLTSAQDDLLRPVAARGALKRQTTKTVQRTRSRLISPRSTLTRLTLRV